MYQIKCIFLPSALHVLCVTGLINKTHTHVYYQNKRGYVSTTVKVRKSGLLGDWVEPDFKIFRILGRYF